MTQSGWFLPREGRAEKQRRNRWSAQNLHMSVGHSTTLPVMSVGWEGVLVFAPGGGGHSLNYMCCWTGYGFQGLESYTGCTISVWGILNGVSFWTRSLLKSVKELTPLRNDLHCFVSWHRTPRLSDSTSVQILQNYSVCMGLSCYPKICKKYLLRKVNETYSAISSCCP